MMNICNEAWAGMVLWGWIQMYHFDWVGLVNSLQGLFLN